MNVPIEDLLGQAREARRDGRGDLVLEALRHATALAVERQDPAMIQLAAWRLTKAEYDFGSTETLATSLDVLLALPSPYVHYPSALGATEAIARRLWDHLGYADDRPLRLWTAWSRHQRDIGDPWLEAQGRVQQAWHLACRGDLERLKTTCEPIFQLTPARFGRGPTKHPDAPATTVSLYWAQADLARTLLRGATWCDEERIAHEAREILEDSLALAERSLRGAPWCIDAICRAADRFGWTNAPWEHWLRVIDGWSSHPVQAGIGRGVISRRAGKPDRAIECFVASARLANSKRAGFEWEVDALVEAQRTRPDSEREAYIATLRSRWGVGLA